MKTTTQKALSFVAASLLALLAPFSAQAQTTYAWDQQARGQEFQHCPNLDPQYYPNNSLWVQSLVYGPNCENSANVVYQPSNWTPTPPAGVYPGGPGLTGVDVVLGPAANPDLENASVTVNHLTIQTNGGLYLGYFGFLTATTIDIQWDTIIGAGSYAGQLNVANGGSLTKSGGVGNVGFGNDGFGNAVGLNALNASLVVESGTFALPYEGAGGWFGGTFAISNNATVLLNVDGIANPSLCDTITGVGGGTVLMTGTIRTYGSDYLGNLHNGLTLNFPGSMFQWTGGAFNAGGAVTNLGILNLTNAPGLQATMFNSGLLKLADNSTFGLGSQNLYNQAGGTLNILGNSSVTGGLLINSGLLVKSAGAGVAQISARLNNSGGIIEADSGTLALNLGGSGSYYTNTSFVAGNGATVSFLTSNFTAQVDGTMTGSGSGAVLMNNGSLVSLHGASLDFPANMFQWAGGSWDGSGSIRNKGTINLVGSCGMSASVYNEGIFIQSNEGRFAGGLFYNDTGATYQIQNDSSISPQTFYNYGLLTKSGGSGTSFILNPFYNYGPIVAATGTLVISNNFYQQAGVLTLASNLLWGANAYQFQVNGGTVTGVGTFGGPGDYVDIFAGNITPGNPFGTITVPNQFNLRSGAVLNFSIGGSNQFGNILVSDLGYLYLGGALNATLLNGYTPPVGTQFQLISCQGVFGGFANVNIPQGTSLSYSNSGIYLTVTGAVPSQITSPILSGTNFVFSFGTLSNQSYTVYANTNLATTNWVFYTNLIGNGSSQQIVVPAQKPPQRFSAWANRDGFRVRG